jgi:small-conductance mechanosensitive channel
MNFDKVLYADVTVFKLFTAAVIAVLALLVAKGLTLYMRRVLREKVKKDHLEVIARLVYYVIIIVALLCVLPMVGVRLSGLLVAGGIVGLAVGFASQSIISNFISGLFLMVERPIKIGDGVNIDGTVGVVEDIHILSTSLRGYDGLFVRVPNQKVFTSTITNFVAHGARRIEYVIGIRYSDDAMKAIAIIEKIIEEWPYALKNPRPDVFVDQLGESSVDIPVRFWVPTSEWYSTKKELLWKMKTALEAEGIEIPFPQRVVWFPEDLRIKKGSTTD